MQQGTSLVSLATPDPDLSRPPLSHYLAQYSRPNSSEESSAPRRGFMSSGTAQLPSYRGGRCRHRRHGLPSAADTATRPRIGRQPAVGVVVAIEDVRTPATPFVVLSASSVRRADVRPTGRADVRCPGVGVHATGPIQVSGRTGGQLDGRPRPVHPRCPHRAGSGRRRCDGTGDVGIPGSTCCCRRQLGPPLGTRRLRRRARRLTDQGAGPAPGCRSVGWGAEGAGAHKVPAGASWAGCRRDA
jgi:hypothetical protein